MSEITKLQSVIRMREENKKLDRRERSYNISIGSIIIVGVLLVMVALFVAGEM